MDDLVAAIESVYLFINRTAEEVDEGYRWKTINYVDQPQYHYNVFNGVGGIPMFLRDYHAVTGESKALELARGALRWCQSDRPLEGNFQRGVQFGKTGIAFACLHLEVGAHAGSLPGFCEANATHLLSEPVGPVTDLIGGESSNGWYFLKLWERTGRDVYLQGAIRCARWISGNLLRDDLGTYCLVRPDGEWGPSPQAGLSHGVAGVAHFLVLLYDATGDEEWRSSAMELLETLSRHAVPAMGGLNWSPKLGDRELSRCQHSHGASGIGLVFARASVALGDSNLLEIARQAGVAAYAYGDFRKNPTLCTGLAGSGELFVELFKLTKDEIWWDRAKEFARLAMAYKASSGGVDFWPTDTPGLYSADYAYGASGTGLFFLRTLRPLEFELPLL
jgi:lantibiotic modifying enzyme